MAVYRALAAGFSGLGRGSDDRFRGDEFHGVEDTDASGVGGPGKLCQDVPGSHFLVVVVEHSILHFPGCSHFPRGLTGHGSGTELESARHVPLSHTLFRALFDTGGGQCTSVGMDL